MTDAEPLSLIGPLTIDRLVFGGDGLARHDGVVVMARGGLPGDRVMVAAERRTASLIRGGVVEILQPSPQRVEPPCRLVARCGGCPWQALDHHAQLEAKRLILLEQLTRIGRLPAAGLPPVETLSGASFGWRRTIRMAWRNGVLGYREARRNEVVGVESCPVAHEAINRRLTPLAACLHGAPQAEVSLTVNADDGSACLLLDSPRGFNGPGALGHRLMEECALDALALAFPGGKRRYGHAGFLVEPDLEMLPGGFVQANSGVNTALRRRLGLWLDQGPPFRVAADLYAGGGNLTRELAGRAAEHDAVVLAVEGDRGAVEAAGRNVRRWPGGGSVRFVAAPVDHRLTRLADDLPAAPDLVLMDPPRTGARDALPLIRRWKPRRIALLSCDAATLARDLADMTKDGYRIDALALADQFPHTPHLETLVLLSDVAATTTTDNS